MTNITVLPRFRYIAASMLLAASAFLALIPGPVVDNSAPRWIDGDSPAAKAYTRFQTDFGSDEVFVVSVEGRDIGTVLEYIERFNRVFQTDPIIERVISLRSIYDDSWDKIIAASKGDKGNLAPLIAGPLTTALHLLEMDTNRAVLYGMSAVSATEERMRLRDKLNAQHRAAETAGLTVHMAGNPLLNLALDQAGRHVEQRSLPILVAVCIVLLVVFTRSPLTAMAALVPAGILVKASEGVLGLAGISANIVVSIAKPLIFVLLLASTLHIVVGWQDTWREGAAQRDAPWRAVRRKGRSVGLALMTTAVGFGSLALSDVPPIRHFGLLSALGLLAGIPMVLLLFPALLRFIKPNVRQDLGLGNLAWRFCRRGLKARFWFPLTAVLIVGLGLLCANQLRSDPHAIHYFQPDHHLRSDHKALERQGLGLATAELVITAKRSLLNTDDLKRVGRVAHGLAGLKGVKQVIDPDLMLREAAFHALGFPDYYHPLQLSLILANRGDTLDDFVAEKGRKLRLSLLIDTLDAEALEGLRRGIETEYGKAFDTPETDLIVTGNYEILLSTQAGLMQTLKGSLLVTVALMSLFFIFILRSLKVALLALIPNLLPVCLNFLFMYFLKLPLDVGTSMTAAIALGIAVDDTLHFTMAWNPAHPEETARSTGRAIILSSLIIGAGFISLVASDFIPTRNFGLLSSAAMAGALLADLLVLPPLLAWAGPYKALPQKTEVPNERE